MPNSQHNLTALRFVAAQMEAKLPPEEVWAPESAGAALSDVDPSATIDDLSAGGSPEHPADDGPGSAVLAARFEALPIEWVTGEPAVETIRFELSDGLSYVGESADPDELIAAAEGDGVAQGDTTETDDGLALNADEVSAESDSLHRSVGGEEAPADDASESESVGGDPSQGANEDLPESAQQVAEGYLSEADHAALIEAARAEAYEQGLRAGREQGLTEGEARGMEKGREQLASELQAEIAAREQSFNELVEGLRRSASDPQRLFLPMKRLALHLAQQLVRGELSISGEAIDRLIEQCLLEVDRNASKDVVLSLNPEDLERWKHEGSLALDAVQVRADPVLSSGSVRLSVGESVVEDLIEHRLQSLATRLLGESHGRSFPRMTPMRPLSSGNEDISDVY